MTNQSNNPNSFLEPFYNETLLINGAAIFGAKINGIPTIIGTFGWYDVNFEKHTPVELPINTKKAVVRVMVQPNTIAPKHPVFVCLDGNVPYDYDNDSPYVLNYPSDPKAMPLLDGSEIEVFGYENIKKLMFFNNRSVGSSLDGTEIKYNANPINFLLNISLFK